MTYQDDQKKIATGVTDGSKVTIDRAKLEQVLETLELCNGAETVDSVVIYTDKEITVIKEALEDV